MEKKKENVPKKKMFLMSYYYVCSIYLVGLQMVGMSIRLFTSDYGSVHQENFDWQIVYPPNEPSIKCLNCGRVDR